MSAKKKKAYAAVVSIGLVALIGDQLLTAEAPPAKAAGRTVARKRAPNGTGAVQEEDPGALSTITAGAFPQGLPEPGPDGPIRDAFGLTPTTHETLKGPSAESPAAPGGTGAGSAAEVRTTIEDFCGRHRLTAVMHGADVGIAVVDDQWMRPGESLDDCTLIEITGRSASFECADGLAKLHVEIAGVPPSH